MSFINRFIKVPIQIFDHAAAEITGKRDYESCYEYILPTEIDGMFPTTSSDQEDKPVTFLYFKSGRSLVIELHVDKFIELLNQYSNR